MAKFYADMSDSSYENWEPEEMMGVSTLEEARAWMFALAQSRSGGSRRDRGDDRRVTRSRVFEVSAVHDFDFEPEWARFDELAATAKAEREDVRERAELARLLAKFGGPK